MLVILSCGKKDFPDYQEEIIPVHFEEHDGVYKGRFKNLNPRRARVRANALMSIKGRQFYVKVAMMKGKKGVRYQQYIHEGPFCPTMAADRDRNGIIDFTEVQIHSGEILVPLDRKLKSQLEGNGWYPTAGIEGSYYYSKAARLEELMTDLYLPDPFPGDGMRKLKSGEKFNPGKRVIIIYGTPLDPLLPVACAEMTDFHSRY
ncbi:MAG: hypothetical protein ACLGHN_02295 [Bacteriovoracia bacterium]